MDHALHTRFLNYDSMAFEKAGSEPFYGIFCRYINLKYLFVWTVSGWEQLMSYLIRSRDEDERR